MSVKHYTLASIKIISTFTRLLKTVSCFNKPDCEYGSQGFFQSGMSDNWEQTSANWDLDSRIFPLSEDFGISF